jgi:hypothetical protein
MIMQKNGQRETVKNQKKPIWDMGIQKAVIIGIVLGIFGSPVCLHAENWRRVSDLGEGYRAIIEYKGSLFAFYPYQWNGLNDAYISVSDNGTDWAIINTLPEIISQHSSVNFRIHNEALYVFQWDYENQESRNYIFRTTDGELFQEVRKDVPTVPHSSEYKDAISFKNHLYVVLGSGQVIRTTGDDPLEWENDTVDPIPDWDMNIPVASLAELNNFLYVVTNQLNSDDGSYSKKIYRKTDDNKWQLVGLIPSESIKPGRMLFSANNKLYLMTEHLWETEDAGPFQEWIKVRDDFGIGGARPYVLDDNVYLWSKNKKVLKLNTNGAWEEASQSDVTMPFYWYELEDEKPAILNNTVHITASLNWDLKLGIENITAHSVPGVDLFQGQENIPILGMNIVSNLRDTIKLAVKNLGTALSGVDIEKVSLVRSLSDPNGGSTLDPLGELIPDSENSWTLPSFQSVNDGDLLFITVDISPRSRVGKTVALLMDLEWIQSEINPDFDQPGTVVSLQAQEIKPGALRAGEVLPISDVIIYPQPARDQVRFQYDLDSTSDVTIKIFNRKGKLVSELSDPGKVAATPAKTVWDATSVAPGTYYAHFTIQPHNGPARQFTKPVFIER